MKRLSPITLTVSARIYESGQMVDAWDWVRTGTFRKCDEYFYEMCKLKPDDYRRATNGIWIRRKDVLMN